VVKVVLEGQIKKCKYIYIFYRREHTLSILSFGDQHFADYLSKIAS